MSWLTPDEALSPADSRSNNHRSFFPRGDWARAEDDEVWPPSLGCVKLWARDATRDCMDHPDSSGKCTLCKQSHIRCEPVGFHALVLNYLC